MKIITILSYLLAMILRTMSEHINGIILKALTIYFPNIGAGIVIKNHSVAKGSLKRDLLPLLT